jgi:hypothetical protein
MKKIDFIFRLLLSLSVLVGLLIALAKSTPVTGIVIKKHSLFSFIARCSIAYSICLSFPSKTFLS